MNEMHLALHGVAIKKHAPAAAVAAVVGLPAERTEALLKDAAACGRLMEAQGGYALTPAGRMILDNQYSRFCDALREDAASATLAAHSASASARSSAAASPARCRALTASPIRVAASASASASRACSRARRQACCPGDGQFTVS